jgi:hypothetical protein
MLGFILVPNQAASENETIDNYISKFAEKKVCIAVVNARERVLEHGNRTLRGSVGEVTYLALCGSAQDPVADPFEHHNEPSGFRKGGKYVDHLTGPYYPLGTIGTVPRAYDIFRAYKGMEGRTNTNKEMKKNWKM